MLFESAVNRLLRLDRATLTRLGELEGRLIQLQTGEPQPFTLFVSPEPSGVRLSTTAEREPDVTLSGDAPAVFRFALRRFFPDVVAAGEVQIRGDIELGQRFQRLLEQADVDWEEYAARILGDVPAHQLGNIVREFGDWSRHVARTLQQDLGEYLQEESRLLPERERVRRFGESVEALQRDLEQLEARVSRLGGTRP